MYCKESISVRCGTDADIANLVSFDQIAHREERRRELIRRSVTSETCFVAEAQGRLIGYVVLNYTFYENGWIDMLYVDADHRRRGAGRALLNHVESVCKTPKLFTSTNLSNLPMQSLLSQAGFALSGVIQNLDEDDAEIVYCKRLR